MLSLAVAAEVTMGWSQVRDWARTAVTSNEYSDMGALVSTPSCGARLCCLSGIVCQPPKRVTYAPMST